jgi:hypothetical protein
MINTCKYIPWRIIVGVWMALSIVACLDDNSAINTKTSPSEPEVASCMAKDSSFVRPIADSTQPFREVAASRAYTLLDDIKEHKKQQLQTYLQTLESNALQVQKDSVLLSFFGIKSQYFRLHQTHQPPQKMQDIMHTLKKKVDKHFLTAYGDFFDMLFVNQSGDIIYTIRKESDYHQNLFKGSLATTSLAKQLQQKSQHHFIDFQYYPYSQEPSAFIAIPILPSDTQGSQDTKATTASMNSNDSNSALSAGWIVLQCGLQKINQIFSRHQGVGYSGETILVNQDHYLLTDSRFLANSSAFQQKLAHENIAEKFKLGSGHKVVVDYQNNPAFTSFEVFEMWSSKWLIISKMNIDEAFTRLFCAHAPFYSRYLQAYLQNPVPTMPRNALVDSAIVAIKSSGVPVYMDDFERIDSGGAVYTHGVNTCTGLLVYKPGEFAYVAHLSPHDKMYGGHNTDLLAEMLYRIHTFDALPSQKQALRFLLISPNLLQQGNVFTNIISTLGANGYMLSQISVASNPAAYYANLHYDLAQDSAYISWHYRDDTVGLDYLEKSKYPTVHTFLHSLFDKP